MPDSRKVTNEQGLCFGRYRAVVVSNEHPNQWHMAKIRAMVLHDDIPDKDLPWAEYILPLGAREKEGGIMPVQPGDLVWVSFEFGDTRKPIIEGAVYRVDGAGTGESLLPQDAWAAKYAHKRTGKQPAAPKHAYGDKVFDQMTFLQQLTMSGEYCLTHKPSGTAIHVNEKGQLVIHAEADYFQSTTGNQTIEVDKEASRTVKGGDIIMITGDRSVKAANISEEATLIQFNGGKGVVQGDCICALTGKPHSDFSATVRAGK